MTTTLRLPLRATTLHLTHEEAQRVLDALPRRARYQRAYARGLQRVSGSDLTGAARQYGGRYEASRRVVRTTAEALGITLLDVQGQHGARSLWSADALLDLYTTEN